MQKRDSYTITYTKHEHELHAENFRGRVKINYHN